MTSFKWIECVCVIKVNEYQQQDLDLIIPETYELNEKQKHEICKNSIPLQISQTNQNELHTFYFNLNEESNYRLHCYCSFWKKEKTTPGVCIVLITRHAFTGLFKGTVRLMSKACKKIKTDFNQGITDIVNSSLLAIKNYWPVDLEVGKSYELPVLGSYFQVYSPLEPEFYQYDLENLQITPNLMRSNENLYNKIVSKEYVCGKTLDGADLNLFSLFAKNPQDLWLIWQLLISGESILIIGDSPSQVSDVALALSSLIFPLKLSTLILPRIVPNTNSFNLLVDYYNNSNSSNKKNTNNLIDNLSTLKFIIGIETKTYKTEKFIRFPHELHLNPKVKLKTKTKLRVPVRKDILKKIKVKSGDKIDKLDQNSDSLGPRNKKIRDGLYNLTKNFLMPLEQYFISLVPFAKDIVPFLKKPILKGFQEQEFISFLLITEPGRYLKGGTKDSWELIYRKFLHTPAFKDWYNSRVSQTVKILKQHYRYRVLNFKINAILKSLNINQKQSLFEKILKNIKSSLRDVEFCNVLIKYLEIIVVELPGRIQKKFNLSINEIKSLIEKSQLKKKNNLEK
ncbi:hypothetical protein M0813_24777 [Anaeramoeba flamelloides]|uniref:UDENN domain-containing protein n=1 Tax=Anaeramoeba flamelloides TaxID=1746091 RepID=A0ABQ8Y4W1_9EUKA|nr:hypothetical protein M0813_24777 [Anaeramoeba flamelloides]